MTSTTADSSIVTASVVCIMVRLYCRPQQMMTLHNRQDIPVKLIGSWTTSIGPIQDQAGNVLTIQSYNVFKLKSH